MDRSALMGIVLAFLAVLLVLMYLGWRARQRRQASLATPHSAPAELGSTIGSFAGLYVATTTAGNPLDRIAVHGLGFRAKTVVIVANAGVALQIAGQDDTFIPVANLRELRRATWTIDRVVEAGGLQLLAWTLGEVRVDSYLRMAQPEAFEGAIALLLASRPNPATLTESGPS